MMNPLVLALALPGLVLLYAAGEFVFEELLKLAVKYSLRGHSADPWVSGAIYLCLGATAGSASTFLLPHRLFPVQPPFPGISLLLAPLGTGLLMQAYGSWRHRRGRETSWLATFWGGALLGFAIALARWVAVGLG